MITLNDAATHLRLDEGTVDPVEIEAKLMHACAIVQAYVGTTEWPFDMMNGLDAGEGKDFTAEAKSLARKANLVNWKQRAVDAAVLLVLGELWRSRESGTTDPLSPSVRRILDMFRTPTYA